MNEYKISRKYNFKIHQTRTKQKKSEKKIIPAPATNIKNTSNP